MTHFSSRFSIDVHATLDLRSLAHPLRDAVVISKSFAKRATSTHQRDALLAGRTVAAGCVGCITIDHLGLILQDKP